jgi:hypothetical protein
MYRGEVNINQVSMLKTFFFFIDAVVKKAGVFVPEKLSDVSLMLTSKSKSPSLQLG